MARTEKRDMLEALNEHLVNSPLTVIGWDRDFRVVFWSGQAQAMFGWSEEELLGKSASDWRFVHDADASAVADIWHDLQHSGTPRNISKNRNYTRDGRILHCEWFNSVLPEDTGEAISVLSLVQDVTPQVTMEAQLRQLHKMEAVGQLTGGIAHDFNNLLTVILGNGELLQEALDTKPELKTLVDTIVSAATKGAKLTHQLLAFARQQPLRPRPTDVNDLLGSYLELLKRALGEQVHIRFLPDAGKLTAMVDDGQLEAAILNLCINARDAMPAGGQLTIESGSAYLDEAYADRNADVEPGDYVVITVADTGSGIEPEHLDRIFDPFFSTKAEGHGSGLGLSMVFGFIKQSRGHIRIDSEVDLGTTVHMYLPMAAAVADSETRPDPARVPQGGAEVILVVEDDDLLRDYASSQLARLGYEVIARRDGPEALAVIEERDDISLLFTDVIMSGGVNGPELARQAQASRPGLKVLYTSGYTQNVIVHEGQLDPGVLLLSKPYRRDSLARMVRQALEA